MRTTSSNPPSSIVLRLPMWRSRVVLFLMFAGFCALIGRAFWIQGPGNDFYIAKGEKVINRSHEIVAVRGKILDRNGAIIATSLEAKTIIAYPSAVPKELSKEKFVNFARLLKMSEQDLQKKLSDSRSQIFLRRLIEPDVAKAIKELDIPGISIVNEPRRYYPEGESMAHVIGFTNVEGKGQEGMELSNESTLIGKNGQRKVIQDRLGRFVE
ncbi:MAG: penicillin-binding protein 2, partial [Polynucleobacter sp.]|nr:penicillin-binding protein 2 [Polynucleobacter sp.]